MSTSVIGRNAINAAAKFSNILKASSCTTQTAGIVSKALRDFDTTRPLPFPYKEKNYTLLQALWDKTTWRFDENSKIIVVDGAIASGKDKFALELAENLDMAYIPNADLDYIFVNSYGFDERTLDDLVPESCRSFDVADFLRDPTDYRTTQLQNLHLSIRVTQYVDALAHVLSTGQGVVMNRSIYSDFIFNEALHKFGWIRKEYLEYYYKSMEIILRTLMRPHVCIYLDLPVEESIRRVNKRNRPGEKNSPFYRPEVLKYMESLYKNKYLKEIRSHAEILKYDATEPLDVEDIVEDCEMLNLDDYDRHDPKMNDWRLIGEAEWCAKRMNYTWYRDEIEDYVNFIPVLNCPELSIPVMQFIKYINLKQKCPGYKNAPGYNADMGDKGIWTKVKEKYIKVGGQY